MYLISTKMTDKTVYKHTEMTAWKQCSVCFYLQLFVGGLVSYLCYLCLLAGGGIQHMLCCVFLRIVYPMLPVSLDFPFLIAPLVFYNVYLQNIENYFHINPTLSN